MRLVETFLPILTSNSEIALLPQTCRGMLKVTMFHSAARHPHTFRAQDFPHSLLRVSAYQKNGFRMLRDAGLSMLAGGKPGKLREIVGHLQVTRPGMFELEPGW